MLSLRSASTAELSDLDLTELRLLLFRAFDEFSDDDWDHTLGGQHFLGSIDGVMVAHASVVPRELQIGERPLATGYVEGVAVAEEHRRHGYGHGVMAQLGRFLEPRFELGALSAAERYHAFYGRLGWELWGGPTAVIVDGVARRTPEEDDTIMLLQTPSTGQLDRQATIACHWRAGDVW
jgi:aminoglycoside 2'-N-acetyltransferase I